MEEKKTDDIQSAIDKQSNSGKDNLRIYNQGRDVPDIAKKVIMGGHLKGKTDVNPMWRIKRITEIFGPCGIGWKYVIDKQWVEQYGAEVKCFCNVNLYVRDPESEEWSEPIPGVGGSAMVAKAKDGSSVDDDAYKKALTDALSIAMKALGIAADVWFELDKSKYETELAEKAVEEINASKSFEECKQIYEKWKNEYPNLCTNTSPMYEAAIKRIQQFKSAQ